MLSNIGLLQHHCISCPPRPLEFGCSHKFLNVEILPLVISSVKTIRAWSNIFDLGDSYCSIGRIILGLSGTQKSSTYSDDESCPCSGLGM